MPWTADDATRYTKAADTLRQRERWAEVANERLAACLEDGGEQDDCEGRAIRQANAVIAGMEENMGDLQEAVTKTVGGKQYPASDFLVVEDSEKPTTWHLQVKRNGTPDHNLMGGAWAALHGGYRGNVYAGPDKQEAINKLKALYKSEDMEVPGAGEVAMIRARGLLAEAMELMLAASEPMPSADVRFSEIEKRLAELEARMGSSGAAATRAPVPVPLAESASGAAVALVEAAPLDVTGARAPVAVDFRLIKPGWGNKKDNNYYPEDMLRQYAHVLEGVDVYATDHVDTERSERTKVGKVQAIVRFDDGPIGRVLIYDPDTAEKTRNRAAANELQTLEGSIRAEGDVRPGEVDGKKGNIVERLTAGIAYDLVSRAGAGGQAQALAESDAEPERIGGDNVTDEQRAPQDEQEQESVQEAETVTIAEQQEAAEAEPAPSALDAQTVAGLLGTSGLPDVSAKRLAEQEYADESALQDAIATEKAYIAELTGAGQPFALGESAAPAQRMTAEEYEANLREVERRHGIVRD